MWKKSRRSRPCKGRESRASSRIWLPRKRFRSVIWAWKYPQRNLFVNLSIINLWFYPCLSIPRVISWSFNCSSLWLEICSPTRSAGVWGVLILECARICGTLKGRISQKRQISRYIQCIRVSLDGLDLSDLTRGMSLLKADWCASAGPLWRNHHHTEDSVQAQLSPKEDSIARWGCCYDDRIFYSSAGALLVADLNTQVSQ